MGAVSAVTALAVALVALLAIATSMWSRGRTAQREVVRVRREHEQAETAARWEVEIEQSIGYTDVLVVRTARTEHESWRVGEPMVVASIESESPTYEVELNRAGAAARQRRDQLNGFRPDSEAATG